MKWIVLILILITYQTSNAQVLHGDSVNMHIDLYRKMRTWSVKAKKTIQLQDSAIVSLQNTVSDLSGRILLRDTLLLRKDETIQGLNNALKNCNPNIKLIDVLKRPEPYIMTLAGIVIYAVVTRKQ